MHIYLFTDTVEAFCISIVDLISPSPGELAIFLIVGFCHFGTAAFYSWSDYAMLELSNQLSLWLCHNKNDAVRVNSVFSLQVHVVNVKKLYLKGLC